MRFFNKHIFHSVILLTCLHPTLGSACAILSEDQRTERKQRLFDEAKVETLKLKEHADQIFIGFLTKQEFEEQTIETLNGPQLLQHHRALFNVADQIKGLYQTGQALEYTINKSVVRFGCRPEYWQLPKENGTGEMYLVYARDGKILRINHIPLDTQTMSGYEEAALLRAH